MLFMGLHLGVLGSKLRFEGGEVMRTLGSSEASMARINGILMQGAIVVAIAAATVLPLLR
ncbi:hypothetical protein AB4Z10_27285 [Bosea sp. RAF48]|uniref:hypothetical protein n=1 Tax=Bosea sp. RAF48 TaxID=3237480 RepID=UPI003F8DC23E